MGGAAIQVAAGSVGTCALLAGGDVRCWGRAGPDIGQPFYDPAGDGTPLQPGPEDVGDDEVPADVPAVPIGSPAKRLLARATCAELEDDRVACWGWRNFGDIYGPQANPYVPLVVELDIATPVRAVTRGFAHLCAAGADGYVTCHGDDKRGQIGVGRGSLEAIEGRDWAIWWDPPGSHGVVSLPAATEDLALGSRHSCALMEGGAITCWGDNVYGQLGRGDTRTIGDDELPEGTVELLPPD